MKELVRIKGLKVHFFVDAGVIQAVDDVDLLIRKGEIVGIVGESGAGKSVTALSIIKIIRPPGKLISGEIWLEDENISNLDMKGMRKIRGKRISMIFQDPMSSLNPRLKIGDQISETILLHRLTMDNGAFIDRMFDYRKRLNTAKKLAIENMNMVGIPDAHKRYDCYPHEFSGGMRQRAMIAMALAVHPDLLIADEPTTALDVTIQAQIIQLLRDLNSQIGMSVLIITHDMSVISEICERVYVMYAGKVHEEALVEELFENPQHPYTQALLNCIPRPEVDGQNLQSIKGEMPDLISPPAGCSFAPRCQFGNDSCIGQESDLIETSSKHWVRCRLSTGT